MPVIVSNPPTYDLVRELYRARGFKFCNGGPFDLNFFGIRRNTSNNKFDDVIGCAYLDTGGLSRVELWKGTTDPGRAHLLDPINAKGTAIIAPGRHTACWAKGLHKGKPALVQVGPIQVYRDGDRDTQVELFPDALQTARGAGLNFHKMGSGRDDRNVDLWSAGCQGTEDPADHDRALELADAQIRNAQGDKYSYALFDLSDNPAAQALFDLLGF